MKPEIRQLFARGALLAVLGSQSPMACPSKTITAQTGSERFINNRDETVADTLTGLMWAARDNGTDISWDDAEEYCENYTGGGYSDWRMPTVVELMSLYDENNSCPARCEPAYSVHITPLIELSCSRVWASERIDSSGARSLSFTSGIASTGHEYWSSRSFSKWHRALAVRSPRAALDQSWRFIDSGDGTVTDTLTHLMWAAKDNGGDITWDAARRYCTEFTGGGYDDWRMPTIAELRGLYDENYSLFSECAEKDCMHIAPFIHLSCYQVWCAGPAGGSSDPWGFNFIEGDDYLTFGFLDLYTRALPVRATKSYREDEATHPDSE